MALKKQMKTELSVKNALAIGGTLVAHGARMDELLDLINNLSAQVAGLKAELEQQKQQIHRSLVQTYGTGPTA